MTSGTYNTTHNTSNVSTCMLTICSISSVACRNVYSQFSRSAQNNISSFVLISMGMTTYTYEREPRISNASFVPYVPIFRLVTARFSVCPLVLLVWCGFVFLVCGVLWCYVVLCDLLWPYVFCLCADHCCGSSLYR